MKTLKDVKIGETVKVVKINREGALRRRKMDMGITKGQFISVSRVAPLGDPIEIAVRSYELSHSKCNQRLLQEKNKGKLSVSDKIDRIVTDRFLALPIFLH